MSSQKPGSNLKLFSAVLIPILAGLLQWLLWSKLPPLTWILLYPAVFLSAWISGCVGGLLATGIAVMLGIYFFIPPYASWAIADFRNVYSAGIFLFMGTMFSVVFGRLHQTTAELERVNGLELETEQKRLIQALHAADAGIWEWNVITNQHKWTDSLWRLFGLEPNSAEASYNTWLESMHPDDREIAEKAINDAIGKRAELSLEWRVASPVDGKERRLMSRGQPEFNDLGQLIMYRGIVIDITERKLIDDALKTSDNQFHLLAESMPQIVWITDADGGNIYFNQQWVKYTGLSLEQSYGNGWNIPTHPDDKQRAWDAWQIAVKNKENCSLECRLQRADGIYRWWLIRGIPVIDENGSIVKWFGTCTDIDDIKAAEVALRESETRWQFALDGSNQGVWDWNIPDGKVFYSNRWKTMLGYTEQEVSDRLEEWSERVHPDDLQAALVDVQRHWRGETAFYQHENRMRNSHGEYQWISARGIVVSRDTDGQPMRMIGTHSDVSERKLNEEKLREKEQLLAASQAIAGIGSWMVDLVSGQTIWSEETFRLYGLSPETDVPPTKEQFPQLFHPDDRQTWQDWINGLLSGNHATELKIRTQPINGESRWLSAIAQVEGGADGKPLSIIGTVQDISDKIKMAAELQRWADAFQYCAHGIVIGNPDTNRILTSNPAFASLIGYASIEEVEGMKILDLYSPKDIEQIKSYLNESDQLGNIRYESTYLLRDGSELDVLVDLVSVKNADNKVLYRVATIQDISEQKKQEAALLEYHDHLQNLVDEQTQDLIEARDQAERLTQVKSIFLANMSHEIRSPMNAVLGFCYLLEQRPLDENTRNLVRKIHESGHLLLAIINDILDFSKIEAGRMAIENVPFRMSDLLEHLAALMAGTASNKNLEMVIMPPVDADALIGDGMRIQQVLVNLLSNAIKFTEQGEVNLHISIDSETADQLNLRFAVSDTGIGISSEQQKEIFSAFSQADNTISRRFGGSGLGLAISQQLISLMGGELKVDSIVDQGSKFWFVLPLQRNLAMENTPSQLTDLHLLVADDSSIAREALLQIVHSLGWRADAADSGETAIMRAVAKMNSQSPYDLLLLDWKMPGVNGLTVAEAVYQAIPESSRQSAKPPIVLMVTAHSREELLVQPSMDKVDAVLSKPITPSALYNAVARILQRRHPGSLPPSNLPIELTGPQIPGVRVLVVDDNDINREVAQHILESEGGLVSLANDGLEALEWLSIHANEVDIVLMDIQMPRMDGYTATREIRQSLNLAALPVVALTAGATKDLEDAAIAAGMDDFITKPFNVQSMITVIQRLTACKPEANYRTENVDVSESKAFENLRPKLNLAGIDVEAGLKIWRQIDVYQTYLSLFISQYQNAGQEIASSAEHGDNAAAAALTHKLKGSAYILALKTVAQRSIDVETALTNGTSVASATAALQTAIEEVSASLSTWLSEEAIFAATHSVVATLPGEIEKLLMQLLAALDEDSPGNAEQLLITIENLLGTEAIAPIKEQLQNFNFREAEVLSMTLMHKLNLPIK